MLPALGISIILSEGVEMEAIRRLDELRKKLVLHFDPLSLFRQYLSTIPLLHVPQADRALCEGVNKPDQHVVAAARQNDAWILTGDAPLIFQAQKLNVPARFPWDLLMDAAVQHGHKEDIGQIIRVVPPSRQTGLIFARVLPGAWWRGRDIGQFTVCEIKNVGRIYYDTHRSAWVFALATGDEVNVDWPMDQEGQQVVCGTYRLFGPSSGGQVRLRASGEGRTNKASSVKTKHRLTGTNCGPMSFGHSLHGQHYWNGHLRSIVVGPQGLGNENWKALTSIPEAAPNPYDSNALERTLRLLEGLLQSQPAMITAISEQQLRSG